MIGLMVIGGIILYLFIAYKVTFYIANKTKKKRYWIGSILFFILLPTWDVIIGKIYFQITAEYMLYGIMKNLYMLEKHLG